VYYSGTILEGLNKTTKTCQDSLYTRTVCKIRGLTLLLRVGTLWRCGDGLFFEVSPLASDALLTTLHLLFENGVTVVSKNPFQDGGATLAESQRCAIEKWQWMRSPRSVEPH
jgi:hypothetical protein